MKSRFWGTLLLVVGVPLCSLGLWQLLAPLEYQAWARIKIEPDVTDIAKISTNPDAESFNSYIESEFNVIQSDLILNQVVESLHLNDGFGQAYQKGKPFTSVQSIRFLRRHLKLRKIEWTKLVEIRMTSRDPQEAARLANGVATAYFDQRHAQLRDRTVRGIEALQARLREVEEKFAKNLTNLTHQTLDAESQTNKLKELDEQRRFIESLKQKIKAEQIESDLPKCGMVQIIDIARPPIVPSGPNRPLAAGLLISGLILSGLGISFLRLKPRPAP